VDAVTVYTTNEIFPLNKRRAAYNILDPNNYGVPFYTLNLFTDEQFSTANPKTTAAFAAACNRGWRYALNHPEEIVDLIKEKYDSQGKSREHLLFEARELRRFIQPEVFPIGSVDPEQIRKIQKVFVETGFTEKVVDPASFIFRVEQDRKTDLTSSPRRRPILSAGERDFLKKHPIIKMSNTINYEPITFVGSDGRAKGLAVDYIKLVAQKTGMNLEFGSAPFGDLLKMAQRKEIDILGMANKTKAREKFLL